MVLLPKETSRISPLESRGSPKHPLKCINQEKAPELANRILKLLEEPSVGPEQAVLSECLELIADKPTSSLDKAVLDHLAFPEMETRGDVISRAHDGTFEWIYAPNYNGKDVLFNEWLSTRNGIFWIKGKPGSGKSTLMKYISSNASTYEALHRWAGSSRLLTAKFFFWLAGSFPLQRTQLGLLRSILYELLSKMPEMIRSVLPKCYEQARNGRTSQNWTLEELHAAFDRLTVGCDESTRICLFIDGLDEYDCSAESGNSVPATTREIAKTMIKFASKDNVKVCISSRPRNAFEHAFKNTVRFKMILSEYTTIDIRHYVSSCFNDDETFNELVKDNQQYEKLVDHITDMSDGVWLWVAYAVKDICEGLDDGDSLDTIIGRLGELPTSLDGFFQRMLDSIQLRFKKQAAKIFLLSLIAPGPIPIMALHVVGLLDSRATNNVSILRKVIDVDGYKEIASLDMKEQTDEEFGIELWSNAAFAKLNQDLLHPLNARVHDLMDIVPQSTTPPEKHVAMKNRVVFMHRTAYDFLRSRQDSLQNAIGEPFHPHFHLQRIYVTLLRVITLTHSSDPDFDDWRFAVARGQILANIMVIAQTLHKQGDSAHHYLLDYVEEVFVRQSALLTGNVQRPELCTGKVLEDAVERGLVEYVRKRLEANERHNREDFDVEIRLRDSKTLYDDTGLSRSIFPNTLLHVSLPTYRKVNMEMLRLLLAYGAQPNLHRCDDTAWEKYLAKIIDQLKPDSHNADVMELLLDHGAGPEAFGVYRKLVVHAEFEDCSISPASAAHPGTKLYRLYTCRRDRPLAKIQCLCRMPLSEIIKKKFELREQARLKRAIARNTKSVSHAESSNEST